MAKYEVGDEVIYTTPDGEKLNTIIRWVKEDYDESEEVFYGVECDAPEGALGLWKKHDKPFDGRLVEDYLWDDEELDWIQSMRAERFDFLSLGHGADLGRDRRARIAAQHDGRQ